MKIRFYKDYNAFNDADKKNDTTISLIADCWNDFGYKTTFDVVYKLEMLGKVKLYVPGIANIISKYGYPDGSVYEYLYEKSTVSGENTQNYWELNKTTRNNEIKMSLGNKQYYSNILKNVPSNCLSDYLTSIVDISALKEKDISSYASNSIVSQSLCRDVESKFVFDLVRLSKELNFDSSDILKLIECDKPQIHKLYVRARDQERKRISSLYSGSVPTGVEE
ncbi:hypothetical protein [Lacticaseibacillus zhaodongensis]|uniref:hypothetical protein n=1 Tax=Lacticaseibacillus zhaodongensis TaxID=2668065 RepID=UPI0012D30CC5|nr:hypothetical protein [Lacticaseibacillus zhaodongensis]